MPKYRYRFYRSHNTNICCLLFNENIDRPTDTTCNYLVGDVCVILGEESYAADLYSTNCLDSDFEWNRVYFDKLWKLLPLFQVTPDEESTDVVILKVADPHEETVVLTARCKKQFGKPRQEILGEFLEKYTEQERRKAATLILEKESKQASIAANLQRLEEVANKIEVKKRLLLAKLSGLYREKIKKLKEMDEDTQSQKGKY